MWHTIFIQPIFNLLILIYNILPYKDIGLAVIILTILIKVILFPFQYQGMKTQKKMALLTPELKKIKEKHKNDLTKQAEEMRNLYKKHRVNPFATLAFLIQIPVIFALYRVFWGGFLPEKLSQELYHFVANPGQVNLLFLGIIDLSQRNFFLAFLTGLTQYLQSKFFSKQTLASQSGGFSKKIQEQMIFLGPIFSFIVAASLPSIIALYWLVSNLFSFVESFYLFKKE